jgi:endonuclease YncB( thermonuclease family)
MIIKIAILALMLISAGSASLNYPSGIVTHVVDGDTFDVQGIGLVTLSQVKSPEMGTIEGVHAREFAMERLLNVVVFLDKDDLASINADGAIPCLVYLSGSDGKPNLNKSFNKIIVEAGFAVIKNDTQSEFDTSLW